MRIGVLALQGSVSEHIQILKRCGVTPIEVRLPEDLKHVDGLVIPGGESTTIGKLMERFWLDIEIKRKYEQGMPIYGTCAGAILLAKHIVGSTQARLGLMDITVKRNDYGRQVDSFEADLTIQDKPFKGIFIRAPIIKAHKGCKVLAEYNKHPVLVQQKNLLAGTFHPELTNDTLIHEYFISMVKNKSF
ncbi:MAG TPA: pyridoxal 5'-phosphate synthase glutaminase subunit PdxT [Candidatus Nanoarchaeia archaeon]|nr:pyridoxal 5'-phosphate synthase glutaminase subunit PdxT [Candidatus Nanoarchaeia archaeon]